MPVISVIACFKHNQYAILMLAVQQDTGKGIYTYALSEYQCH